MTDTATGETGTPPAPVRTSVSERLRRTLPALGSLQSYIGLVLVVAAGIATKGLVFWNQTNLTNAITAFASRGLTLHHTRGHLYRAALEATAFGVRHNLEAMALSGEEPDKYVAVGGGTTGGLWTQIVSDVVGRPQLIPRHTIGAAYGDAFLAAVAVGNAALGDIADWNPAHTVVEPDAEHHQTYSKLYEHYRNLYPATADVVHALAAG